MRKLIDLTGRRFGRWLVLGLHPKRMRYGKAKKAIEALWLVRCSCDRATERLVFGSNLRPGKSTSCGCLRREQTIKRSTKHGHARRGKHTSIYDRWVSMRRRCFDPNNKRYPDYGGRGITPCERWSTFVNYYSDVGDPPPGKSLDRIDNDGNYEPDNCQWATRSEQRRNQRPRKKRGIKLGDPKILAGLKQLNASLARIGAGT